MPELEIMDEWSIIPGFNGRYLISCRGEVYSKARDRVKKASVNSRGIHYVLMQQYRKPVQRSITLLVAQAFVPQILPTFDTPINLDGDRSNNHYWNIAWRPRWFAVKYVKQFVPPSNQIKPIPRINSPLVETTTGEKFPHSMYAVRKYGILDRDIYNSVMDSVSVWPTYQRFRIR